MGKFAEKFTYPQAIQNMREFESSFEQDLEKCCITLAHQWIFCSEWVPSEWEFKHHNNDSSPRINILWDVYNMFIRNKPSFSHFYFKPSLLQNSKNCFGLFLLLRCLICAYFSHDSDETTFSLAFTTRISPRSNGLKLNKYLYVDMFITNM